ncbi:MAG: GDSL-type esterase/lipase family protein [Gemmataceae bacterium]|nr:GDSL-type esterase/lipase family protein [Gemmataceae bacterium]MDW8266743.1 GDSL-type esterase/lipase family protein [Gemmataceae bacterium]
MRTVVSIVGLFLLVGSTRAGILELHPGDHIGVIGNTLADRMQHHGWLETLIQARFPEHRIVYRDLGYAGDELTLRLRSQDFGTPDDWLRRVRADVVLAFFGYNESFAGREGLEKFKKDLTDFIQHTTREKYNGRTPPRLVLFSPIAHEDLKDPNLPDGRENNARIQLYTTAMAEVARAHEVVFVDLFTPTRELYRRASRPLTINGIHLTEEGNRRLAEIIDRALFGPAPAYDPARLERIRQAVLDKNFHWFQRYRTTDGYSIYGGRADLKFVNGQTNRVVMEREMEVLDAMTANRDPGIWAAAQGKRFRLVDATPPFIPVITNKPGPLPGGKHLFLDGEAAIKKMTLGRNLRINLFASEKEFPDLVNPVQMAWDTRGRLWVAVWPTYPHWKPKEEMNDKLLVLEDTDGDGKADRRTVFADRLHNPTGFEFWNGGVLVAQAPDILFLKDTDGDGKADFRERVLSGIDSADTHHTANSFTYDPGGALYFQEGTFHHTQVETPWGPPVRSANAAVFRFEPRTCKFEVYVAYAFANPHGHVFDRWGQDIVIDGTGANPYHAALFSGYIEFPQKHARPPQVYQQRTRPCPGMEILSSRHFPPDMQGNLLVANVIGFQGILQYRIEDRGASFVGTEVESIVSSTDPNFRPSDIKIGPDGAIYFLDWHNPIIGHMQHNLRDPSRDREHGRIYRVTYEGRPLLKPLPIAGEPIDKLLDLLKEPENRVRYRARLELNARPTEEVVTALEKWVAALDPKDPEHEHQLLEALWTYQAHNVVKVALLERVLASPDFRARAAAARVLCYQRDRVSNALELFRKLATDPHPRVRLEAIRAASFFRQPEALEVALLAAEMPRDPYLDYTLGETLKVLEPVYRAAVARGEKVAFVTDAGLRYQLQKTPTDQLLKLPRSRAVNLELLFRPHVPDDVRRGAVRGLAAADGKSEPRVILDALASLDDKPASQDQAAVFDLIRLLAGQEPAGLAHVRADLEKLATQAKRPQLRQIGFVALVTVDGSVDKAWDLGMRSAGSLIDLLNAVPLISDPGLRARMYPKVEPLLHGLPASLAADKGAKATIGRFVRIELPGRDKTLSLAEVEVYSDGRNVARQGRARQKSTAHGGDAARAIDGKTDGQFSNGSVTYTKENEVHPWWEVDLGKPTPIDRIVVYNRTDGQLGQRLDGFLIKVLDTKRTIVFEQDRIPAPKQKVEFTLSGGGAQALVRRAAMNALTSVRGEESKTFQLLVPFVRDDIDRHAAIRALQRLPRSAWPKEQAQPLVTVLLEHIRRIPPAERTSPAALDALEFADALTTLLPPAEAKAVRAELGELGVRVLRIGTLFERMAYDKELLVVKVGKPVEFIFENTDLMPHNFVIVQPGALEEIGLLAEQTATSPDAQARHYVPRSNKILLASSLLQPHQSEKLSFEAPKEPGVYPYVCTYPGHWRRMFGALYVVADLDDYLADPEGYLARHPMPIKDALLKDNRPRTEWKFEDLASAVAGMSNGRSYSNGKQMFTVATCVACHRLEGVGNQFGPDLTQIDPKWTPIDILKELLDPSARINEKFQSHTFLLTSGKVVTGLVLEETKEAVKVIENPLAKTEPLVLKVADIEERQKSPISMMPKGLLDKLTRDEILDLIAYVLAKGDRNHPLFAGSGRHHGH